MISTATAIEVCKKEKTEDYEVVEVIQRFIFDKYQKDPGLINVPKDVMRIHMMMLAFRKAIEYYLSPDGNKK